MLAPGQSMYVWYSGPVHARYITSYVLDSYWCAAFYFLSRNFANQDKAAARFCHQVAARVPDMFCNLLFCEKS